jgi:hypothetical protein
LTVSSRILIFSQFFGKILSCQLQKGLRLRSFVQYCNLTFPRQQWLILPDLPVIVKNRSQLLQFVVHGARLLTRLRFHLPTADIHSLHLYRDLSVPRNCDREHWIQSKQRLPSWMDNLMILLVNTAKNGLLQITHVEGRRPCNEVNNWN